MEKEWNKEGLLSEINNEFNDSLKDDSFSLTKMFKKGSLPVQIINTLLLTACTTGAFGANAKNANELDVENHFVPTNINYDLIKENYQDAEIITAQNLEEISENKQNGIYKFKGSDDIILLAFENETYQFPREAIDFIQSSDLQQDGSYASHNPVYPDVGFVNVNHSKDIQPIEDYVSNTDIVWDDEIIESPNPVEETPEWDGWVPPEIDFEDIEPTEEENELDRRLHEQENREKEFNNKIVKHKKENWPLFSEHEDLFVLAHELSHSNENQKDFSKSVQEINEATNYQGVTDFQKKLTLEASSDLFGILAVSKIKDLNLEDTQQLLTELSEYREHNFSKYKDSRHFTSTYIDNFNNMLTESPEILTELQNLNIDKLNEIMTKTGISYVENSDLNFKEMNKTLKNTSDFSELSEEVYSKLSASSEKTEEIKNMILTDISKNKNKNEIQIEGTKSFIVETPIEETSIFMAEIPLEKSQTFESEMKFEDSPVLKEEVENKYNINNEIDKEELDIENKLKEDIENTNKNNNSNQNKTKRKNGLGIS